MKIIMAPRGCGKTTMLLNAMRGQPNTYMVVHSEATMRFVRDLVKSRYQGEIAPQHIIAPNMTKSIGMDSVLYVDNAELLLGALLRRPVVALTMSNS